MPDHKNLGKLVAIHGTSPVFLQRAAIVAAVSFLFFFAMLIAFYLRQHFGYFLLSTAFLIVFVFTLIGWWLQKRNAVEIFANGLRYNKRELRWQEIKAIESPDRELVLIQPDGEKLAISGTIYALDEIEHYIRRQMS
ncbi:MAG: hypothetical protein KIT61_11275 [Pyrinomonadaceae bacterium]|nr:hypothetical protein [Blastocatellia bacterium]MCW5957158.1 hypothetical protein [Pyrinomonadaceae bacterium]